MSNSSSYHKNLVFTAACIGMCFFGVSMITLGAVLPSLVTKLGLSGLQTTTPVSYTHLDVYKRQSYSAHYVQKKLKGCLTHIHSFKCNKLTKKIEMAQPAPLGDKLRHLYYKLNRCYFSRDAGSR